MACALWLTTTACAPRDPLALSAAPILYGGDDRVEAVYASEVFEIASRASVAALIPAQALRASDSGYLEIFSPTLSEVFGLCEDEPFAAQPCAALCTGVLITDRHLLTAGHCAPEGRCGSWKIVFGYRYDADDALQIAESGVFDCHSVAAWRNDPLMAARGLDYAVLELDRPATSPLATVGLMRGAPPPAGLALIGASQGLPLKVDEQATLFETTVDGQATLRLRADSFGGGSGAPVLTADGQLLGIVAGGEPDYVQREDEGCQRNRVADTDMNERGEVVTLARDAQSDWCRGIAEGSVECFDAHACGEPCAPPERGQPSGSCSFARVQPAPGCWVLPLLLAGALRRRRRQGAGLQS